jgi:hypothetical protein
VRSYVCKFATIFCQVRNFAPSGYTTLIDAMTLTSFSRFFAVKQVQKFVNCKFISVIQVKKFVNCKFLCYMYIQQVKKFVNCAALLFLIETVISTYLFKQN